MSRYIDVDEFLADESEAYMKAQIALAEQNADKTIDATRYVNQVVHKKIQMLIADAPSIDIVRCGECKYASDNKIYGCMLNHFNDNDYDYHRMYADDFCSYGERKGVANDNQG